MTRATHTRRRRWPGARLLAPVALLALLAPAGAASADTVPGTGGGGLVGVQASAQASGMHSFYNPEGVLPIAAPLDAGSPDALVTMSAGPSTFARSSVLDPGDLLASPNTLLTLFDPDFPDDAIPPYPYRISASSGFGEPEAESAPAPGLSARVQAEPSSAVARSAVAESSAPGLVRFGGMEATSSTESDGTTVTVRARTEVTGIDILGVVTIGSVVTDLVAVSDGETTTLEGGTVVGDAFVLDQPVTIDGDGVHPDPDGEPDPSPQPLLGGLLNAVGGQVTDVLSELGIHITAAGPIETSGERSGELASTGLRVELRLSSTMVPGLTDLLRQLPAIELPDGAPQFADLVELLAADHVTALEFGRAKVSLITTTAAPLPAFDIDPPAAAMPTGGAPPAMGPTGPVPAGGAPAPSVPSGAEMAPGPVVTTGTDGPVQSLGRGLGALAVLALLAQPFIGHRLALLSGRLVAPPAAAPCLSERI